MLRREFVERKLGLIAQDLGHLAHFRGASFEEVVGDFIALAAVERLLERIVMRAVDVNEHLIGALATGREERIARLTYRDTFLELGELQVYPSGFAEEIARGAGLRNILVHDYIDVDRRILYESIERSLDEYTRYVEYVDSFVNRFSGGRVNS